MKGVAFCPAHITGFFKAEIEKKSNIGELGSQGAGFSIQKGVKTTVRVRKKTEYDISNFHLNILGYQTDNAQVSEYVIKKFLDLVGKDVFVDVDHNITVPVGFEIRIKGGAPGHGIVKKIKSDNYTAVIICFSPISTKRFISERLPFINGLGGKMVTKLEKSKNIIEFQNMTLEFAKYVNVITPKMARVIKDLNKNGINCGVAMFGETIFSLVPRNKEDKVIDILKKYDDGIIITSKIDNTGARITKQ